VTITGNNATVVEVDATKLYVVAPLPKLASGAAWSVNQPVIVWVVPSYHAPRNRPLTALDPAKEQDLDPPGSPSPPGGFFCLARGEMEKVAALRDGNALA
jgi:hypothetical protein